MSATVTRTKTPTSAQRARDAQRAPSAEAAIARRTFRQLRVGAIACGVAFGATVAVTAASYVTSFASVASRHRLAATTGRDTGLAVLLGPVTSLDTVGGYTVYKLFVFLTTIAAIWALLVATRVLRGEEDAQRWQLVLAGRTRAGRATAASLAGVAMAIAVVFTGIALFTWLAGRSSDIAFDVGDAVVYATSIVVPTAVFAAVGAVTAQLGSTRRAAAGLGITILAAAFVVRMIADSGHSARWLAWATPFGWSERMHPFTENNLGPLAPAAAAVLVLCAGAITLARRRDAGTGLLAGHDVSRPRGYGLHSPFGLAARLEAPTLAAWCGGVLAMGVAFGIVTKAATAAASSLRDTLDQFDVGGPFVTKYVGVAFLLVAAVVALLPAGQLGAAADEETSGRLVHVLVRPTGRTAWLIGRLVLYAIGIVVVALLAGVGVWIGAATQSVHLGLLDLLGAGANVVPPALLVLGLGTVVFAVSPRATAPAVYALVGGSLVISLLGSTVSSLHALERLSLFHYMALVPAQDPAPVAIVATLCVAVACAIVGVLLFRRRDLSTG